MKKYFLMSFLLIMQSVVYSNDDDDRRERQRQRYQEYVQRYVSMFCSDGRKYVDFEFDTHRVPCSSDREEVAAMVRKAMEETCANSDPDCAYFWKSEKDLVRDAFQRIITRCDQHNDRPRY